MGAALDHPAVVDDQQLVGFADGRESVCDDQRRATTQGLAQGALHRGLGLGVQVRRGFVEHHDVRCLEDEPGQSNPLLLATREPIARVPR